VHEAAIADELLQVIEAQARAHGLTRVERIELRVGAMRMIVPELLKAAFEVMAEGTLAAGAVMEIEHVPLVARCAPCARDVVVEDHVFLCPTCGSALREIVSGKELDLMHLSGEGGAG
jgi:hydrogenase nickel incorporation protein HypA/HybF